MTIGDDSLPDGTESAAAGGAPAVRAQSSAVAPVDGRNIESSPPGRQVGEPTYGPSGRVWSPELRTTRPEAQAPKLMQETFRVGLAAHLQRPAHR
jgi:hypothetical protein